MCNLNEERLISSTHFEKAMKSQVIAYFIAEFPVSFEEVQKEVEMF